MLGGAPLDWNTQLVAQDLVSTKCPRTCLKSSTRRQVVILNCLTKPPKTSPPHLPWLSTFTLLAPAPNCIHSTSGSSLRSAPREIHPNIPKRICWMTFQSHSSPDPWFRDPCYRRRPKCHPGESMKCSSFPYFIALFDVIATCSRTHNKLSIWNINYRLLRWHELKFVSPPLFESYRGLRKGSTSNWPPTSS